MYLKASGCGSSAKIAVGDFNICGQDYIHERNNEEEVYTLSLHSFLLGVTISGKKENIQHRFNNMEKTWEVKRKKCVWLCNLGYQKSYLAPSLALWYQK